MLIWFKSGIIIEHPVLFLYESFFSVFLHWGQNRNIHVRAAAAENWLSVFVLRDRACVLVQICLTYLQEALCVCVCVSLVCSLNWRSGMQLLSAWSRLWQSFLAQWSRLTLCLLTWTLHVYSVYTETWTWTYLPSTCCRSLWMEFKI